MQLCSCLLFVETYGLISCSIYWRNKHKLGSLVSYIQDKWWWYPSTKTMKQRASRNFIRKYQSWSKIMPPCSYSLVCMLYCYAFPRTTKIDWLLVCLDSIWSRYNQCPGRMQAGTTTWSSSNSTHMAYSFVWYCHWTASMTVACCFHPVLS